MEVLERGVGPGRPRRPARGGAGGQRASGPRRRRGRGRQDEPGQGALHPRGPRRRILWGACDPLSTPRPLGPLADIAPAVGGRLEELLRDEAPREVLFSTLLERLRRGPPRASWSSRTSTGPTRPPWTCCGFWPGGSAPSRVLIVATFRDDEVGPSHPLRVALGDLAGSGLVRRLRLEPLSRQAVAALAGAAGVDHDRLYETTGGNPFFVTRSWPPAGRPPRGRARRPQRGGRAVRQGAALAGGLAPASLAELLERHSYECYLTDQLKDAITSRERALGCWRALGDARRQGDTLRWLSRLAWPSGWATTTSSPTPSTTSAPSRRSAAARLGIGSA